MTDAPGPKAADADRIAQGYQVDGAALEFGTVVLDGTAYPDARSASRCPWSTGTG